jgi:fructokinase
MIVPRKNQPSPRYGLIEAGGTKFVAAIAAWNEAAAGGIGQAIIARTRIPTTTPDETLGAALDWFRNQGLAPAAIGIAAFGPLELDPASPDWGRLAATPKPHWAGTDLVAPFARAFACPVGIETDVNGAALAETRWGVGVGDRDASLLYLTVGTGIGGGFVGRSGLLRGASHPEMGHIAMPRHPDDRDFPGTCAFHGDCLEGLASGSAVMARWRQPLSGLPVGHPAHAMIAWYLGCAIQTFQAMLQPDRIVLGGGVMASPGLIDAVRETAAQAGAGYFTGNPRRIVCEPGLGTDSGILGALAVALAVPI